MLVQKFGAIHIAVDPTSQRIEVHIDGFHFDPQEQEFESQDAQTVSSLLAILEDAKRRIILAFVETGSNAPHH